MSRLAALSIVCAAASALAQERGRSLRRPVAVVDLSDTATGEQVAKDLGNILNNHWELKPVDDPILPRELIGKILDEDQQRLTDVRSDVRQVENLVLERRDYTDAVTVAERAQARLWLAPPTPEVRKLYAELAYLVGYARLGDRKPDLARDAFALAAVLDPSFQPDPARTLPEVLQAYGQAREARRGTGKISVRGTGRVIIDGQEVGSSPAWFDATSGLHVVWLVGPDREPRARQVTVIRGQKVELAIEDVPTTRAMRVRRGRLALKLTVEPQARIQAVQQLARVLEVADMVLLTTVDGKLVGQTWRSAARFSEPREVSRDEVPGLLAPLESPAPSRSVRATIPTEPPRPWWRRPRTIGVATVILMGVVGGYVAYDRWDRNVNVDKDPRWATPGISP